MNSHLYEIYSPVKGQYLRIECKSSGNWLGEMKTQMHRGCETVQYLKINKFITEIKFSLHAEMVIGQSVEQGKL